MLSDSSPIVTSCWVGMGSGSVVSAACSRLTDDDDDNNNEVVGVFSFKVVWDA